MKKLIFILLILSAFQTAIFASEVPDLLDKAKTAYDEKNIQETIRLIDSARKILDKEALQSSSDEYTEVTNWDVVKLKADAYYGKKIKITATFGGISDSEKLYIHINYNYIPNTFDKNLVDTVLSLKENSTHTFYGIVKNEYEGKSYMNPAPQLYIEKIE